MWTMHIVKQVFTQGFCLEKHETKNDDVMMRITRSCTRTTQITMVTICAL